MVRKCYISHLYHSVRLIVSGQATFVRNAYWLTAQCASHFCNKAKIAAPAGARTGLARACPVCQASAHMGPNAGLDFLGAYWARYISPCYGQTMGMPVWGPCGAEEGLPLPVHAPVCPWLPVPSPYGAWPGSLSGRGFGKFQRNELCAMNANPYYLGDDRIINGRTDGKSVR